jgi:hypothetical protein
MEAMLGISLYSYPYLNSQKHYVFLIIAYIFSSIKLEKRAEEVLTGRKRGRGEEMAQTMYAHMNQLIKKTFLRKKKKPSK